MMRAVAKVAGSIGRHKLIWLAQAVMMGVVVYSGVENTLARDWQGLSWAILGLTLMVIGFDALRRFAP